MKLIKRVDMIALIIFRFGVFLFENSQEFWAKLETKSLVNSSDNQARPTD